MQNNDHINMPRLDSPHLGQSPVRDGFKKEWQRFNPPTLQYSYHIHA